MINHSNKDHGELILVPGLLIIDRLVQVNPRAILHFKTC
jgi:hypothetical protein